MRVDEVFLLLSGKYVTWNSPVNTTATLDLLQNIWSLRSYDKENMIGYPTLTELW